MPVGSPAQILCPRAFDPALTAIDPLSIAAALRHGFSLCGAPRYLCNAPQERWRRELPHSRFAAHATCTGPRWAASARQSRMAL